MTNPNIDMNDEEIANLLAELEAEQTAAAPTPTPAPAPAPVPVAEVKEPEPEPEPEPAPPVVKEPDPEPAIKVAPRGKEKPVQASPVIDEPVMVPGGGHTPVVVMPEPELIPPADVPQTSDRAGAKLSFYVDVNQFNRDTKLTEATLDAAMMEQSGLRAFYGSQAAQAEAQHARLKVRFDVLEAKLYDEHRKTLAAGGEKVTEKMVENAVKLDPRWIKGKNTVIEAETIAAINKSLVISLADRRDMMIQLGADRREEFKGGVRILAEQNERDSLAARAAAAFKNGAGVQ